MSSISSRLAATVVAGIGWLVFVIIYLAFFAGNFDFWQNIAILIVSCLIDGGIIAVIWITSHW
ncbi:hypothetical protein KAH85_02405 [Candidatus Bathyarchaeota archaeon]|nr:hypothetical protein [Candidatus Bathyarchaeota archaeon]